MKYLYLFLLSALALTVTTCERRSLYDGCANGEVAIPVHIDWSQSGITPSTRADPDYVHRVSIRLFPLDGSPAIERYLEGDVFNGTIDVPVGRYSVVVYNEAIDDPYWSENIFFTDVDSYNNFAANIVPLIPSPYEFYTPQPGEQFVGEPLKLVSWSIDYFEVNEQMRGCRECLDNPDAMINSLSRVVLRPLVTPVRVVVETTNLKSAMRMEGALSGMAMKIYMASAMTHNSPSTHLFAFTSPVWSDTTPSDGWVERRFLSFGRVPQQSIYGLTLGVIFVTGERYQPSQPIYYDVTSQVSIISQSGIEVRVGLQLPVVDEGINVGDWDDEEIIIK